MTDTFHTRNSSLARMAVAPLNMSTPGYVSTGITFRQFVAAHVAAALAPAYASNQPKCEHGATEDETCPECLGAPSDDPNDLLTDEQQLTSGSQS
jgi:hypothetical protein